MTISRCRSQFMHITRVGEKEKRRAAVYHSFLVLLIYYRFHVLWPGLYHVRFRHFIYPVSLPTARALTGCYDLAVSDLEGLARCWLGDTGLMGGEGW